MDPSGLCEIFCLYGDWCSFFHKLPPKGRSFRFSADVFAPSVSVGTGKLLKEFLDLFYLTFDYQLRLFVTFKVRLHALIIRKMAGGLKKRWKIKLGEGETELLLVSFFELSN